MNACSSPGGPSSSVCPGPWLRPTVPWWNGGAGCCGCVATMAPWGGVRRPPGRRRRCDPARQRRLQPSCCPRPSSPPWPPRSLTWALGWGAGSWSSSCRLCRPAGVLRWGWPWLSWMVSGLPGERLPPPPGCCRRGRRRWWLWRRCWSGRSSCRSTNQRRAPLGASVPLAPWPLAPWPLALLATWCWELLLPWMLPLWAVPQTLVLRRPPLDGEPRRLPSPSPSNGRWRLGLTPKRGPCWSNCWCDCPTAPACDSMPMAVGIAPPPRPGRSGWRPTPDWNGWSSPWRRRIRTDWQPWCGWQVRRPALEGDPRPLLRQLLAGMPRLMLSTAFETGIGRRFLAHLAALQQDGPTPTAPGLAPGWRPAGALFDPDPELVWAAAAEAR